VIPECLIVFHFISPPLSGDDISLNAVEIAFGNTLLNQKTGFCTKIFQPLGIVDEMDLYKFSLVASLKT